MKCTPVGVDIAKHVIQVHFIDEHTGEVIDKQLRRQVWARLRRQAELDGMPAINAKRVYRIMRQNALYRHRNGHILAKWP